MNQEEANKIKAYIDTLITGKNFSMVDSTGRFISTGAGVKEPDKKFFLTQPTIDYAAVLLRLKESFTGLEFVTKKEFETQAKELIEKVKQENPNLLNGVYLPICLPQCEIQDYGTALEDIFLPAVEKSYKDQYPDRQFINYRQGELKNKVSCLPPGETNFLKMSKEPLVALIFPICLQGFSIPTSRELILRERYFLNGAIENSVAFVAYPEVLSHNFNTPGIDCSANTWQGPGYSLYFYAGDGELEFGGRFLYPYGCFSGGLSFFR